VRYPLQWMELEPADETQSGSGERPGVAPGPAPGVSPWPESTVHWLEALPEGSAKIGRFTVLERLAAGGMGVVYAAYDSELDRKVAIKVLREDLARGTVRARIVREARAMAKLSHPNVAQVFEVGEYLGSTFIAMEFVQGVTLRHWQVAEPRSWRALLAVYLQAGRGLAAAHAEGLVHRDFKPDNAMIGRDERVRVLDFGLVRAEERTASSLEDEDEHARSAPEDDALATPLTKTGSMLGTPAYMAPEQFLGAEVDHRTDQFGFCVALWEGLFGERPFAGKTRVELVANVIAGRTRPEPKGIEVPAWVRAVLARGLAAEPSQRFASMHGLLAALEADPSRRNRRLLAIGVGVSAVVLAIGGYVMDRARRMQACADQAETITQVWDAAARERVQASLLGTGASFAPSTWARVEPRLDEYATAWSDVREATCLAAELEGTRTEDLATRTTDCLTEHRDAFASLVELLANADATVVQGAASAAARLPRLAECTDDARLARRMQPPADPGVRERVAELRQRFSRMTSFTVTGRYAAGLVVARELTGEAEAVGWAPLHAEALLREGHLAQQAGELGPAERALEQAVDLALREGYDEVAASAAGILVLTTGSSLGRHERGIWWARLGLALATRPSADLDLRTAEISDHVATLHANMGEYAEAKQLHEQVVAIREQSLGPDHPQVAAALVALANVHFQLGTFAEAKALYERALAITESALGPDHPHNAVSLTNLGNIHARAGAFAEAKVFFERALELQTRAFGPDHPRTINTLTGLGRVHIGLGEPAEAKALFERQLVATEAALGPDHIEVGFVLVNLSWAHAELGELTTAVVLGERALVIQEKGLGPDHPEVASALADLASIHARLGEPAKAKVLYERALGAGERSLGPDHHFIAGPLTGLAGVALALGTPAEGIAPAERALRILDGVAEVEPQLRAEARFMLAQVSWASGEDRERALASARQAAAEATKPETREGIERWLQQTAPP